MPDTKICVICGQSCAGQPRIKNDKGQYAHQACAKKQAEQRSAAASPADPDDLANDDALMNDMLGDGLGDGLDDGMLDDALLGDLPADDAGADVGGMQAACPGCGSALAQGTVICLSCGFDTRSGKARKVKVAKQKEPASGISGLAAGAGSAAASGLGYLLFSTIGACVGGAIGAVLWAVLIISLNIEIGYAAIGIGIICGIGAMIGARGNGGMITGVIAVLVTLLSISSGKMFAVMHFTDQAIEQYEQENANYYENLSASDRSDIAIVNFADEMLFEMLENDELDDETRATYQRAYDEGYEPSDYPDAIALAAQEQYDGMSPGEQDAYFDVLQGEIEPLSDEERAEIYGEGFVATFGFMDIVFFLIAIVAAYGVGSGGGDD